MTSLGAAFTCNLRTFRLVRDIITSVSENNDVSPRIWQVGFMSKCVGTSGVFIGYAFSVCTTANMCGYTIRICDLENPITISISVTFIRRSKNSPTITTEVTRVCRLTNFTVTVANIMSIYRVRKNSIVSFTCICCAQMYPIITVTCIGRVKMYPIVSVSRVKMNPNVATNVTNRVPPVPCPRRWRCNCRPGGPMRM